MNEPNRPDPADQPGQSDLDARFADIVAHWDDIADLPTPSYDAPAPAPPLPSEPSPAQSPPAAAVEPTDPDAEGAGLREAAGRDTGGVTGAVATPPPSEERPVSWRAPEAGPGREPEEHFVPPPVAPLPAGDLQFWGILVGLVGGPLVMLYLIIFDRDAPSWWMLLAIAMAAGGFTLLVSRLPGHREDDGDDGARV